MVPEDQLSPIGGHTNSKSMMQMMWNCCMACKCYTNEWDMNAHDTIKTCAHQNDQRFSSVQKYNIMLNICQNCDDLQIVGHQMIWSKFEKWILGTELKTAQRTLKTNITERDLLRSSMRIHHNEIILRNRRFTSANLLGYNDLLYNQDESKIVLCCWKRS